VLKNLVNLYRYRVLIQSLVVRELKARYRGSVLGFLWSFINPLLQLLIYWFVFAVIFRSRQEGAEPYALFLFTGILPWTWFSSSVMESTMVLITSGNLIKKIMFPAEVLPFVVVFANLVHFVLGLPILLVFLIYYGKIYPSLIYFPGIVLIQLVFTLGVCLFVSALSVHFRDVQNIMGNLLMFWFFASPVIYSYILMPNLQKWLNFNPVTHIMVGYHQTLFFGEGLGHWPWILFIAGFSIVVFLFGYFFFDRMRDTFVEEV